MAKWRRNMTPSQRVRYNRYKRFKKLEQGLIDWIEGRRASPPHPRKADPNLLKLYQRYGAKNLVVIPMSWMDKDQVRRVRNRERYQRSLKWT